MNKERTILYLFSINAIIYIASGFYTPFLSAYYAQKGIDAEKIGILLMIGPCVVLLTQRFWAKISDRTGKRKEVLLVTIVGSGFSMLLYYLGNSFLCMFFATVVVTSFTTAVIPLSDAILIARSLKEGYCAVYISTYVYEKYQTKGQSILNVVQLGLGAIVGNLVGGKLIRLLGYEKGYLLMAGITTLMTICALIVYFWKNREQRNGGDVCEI